MRRFPDDLVAAIRDGQILRIRAGTQPHRFIGIWAVVVEGRVFVRSWSVKPQGVEHFSMHTGQIILLTKMWKGDLGFYDVSDGTPRRQWHERTSGTSDRFTASGPR